MGNNDTTSVILKSLRNGLIGWVVVAIIVVLMNDGASFIQGLTSPYAILVGIMAIGGSFVGFGQKGKK